MRLLRLVSSACPIILGAAIVLSPSAWAVNKLYSLGFESSGWEGEFTGSSAWEDHLTRTTSAPHTGSYSLRGNQVSGVTDGITGLTGLPNTLLDWRGSDDAIVANTPNELYFSYWFRHDDYNHVLDDDGSGEGKLVFFVDKTYSTKAMYFSNQLAGTDSLQLQYSNGGYSRSWATTNWGFTSLWLTNSSVSGHTDGTWQQLEYYINYDESYIQIWVDGFIMMSTKHGDPSYPKLPSDGRIYYDPALVLQTKGFQFFWVRSSNIDSSTDGTGYSAGWQIDDLEVWDGVPPSPPSPPRNLTVESVNSAPP